MEDLIRGPYRAVSNDHYWQINDKNDEQVGDTCAAMFDGRTNDDGTDKKAWDRGEAVARLFAAAPELLEALKKISDPLLLPSDGIGMAKALSIIEAMRREALAAIAKAEGRA